MDHSTAPGQVSTVTAAEIAVVGAYDLAVRTWHTVTITEDDGSRVTTEVNGVPCPHGCQFGWHNYCLADCAYSPGSRAPYDPANFPCNGIHGDAHPGQRCQCGCAWCLAVTASCRRDSYDSWARQRRQDEERRAYLDAHPGQHEIDAAFERAYAAGISPWLPCDCPACTGPDGLPELEHEDDLVAASLARQEREARCEQRTRLNPGCEGWQLILKAVTADLNKRIERGKNLEQAALEEAVASLAQRIKRMRRFR